MKEHKEHVPKITVLFGVESNTAFLVACFVFICAVTWAVRDHYRRQTQMTAQEQADKLYLAGLSILFIMSTMGAYFAFRRSTAQKILDEYGEPMEERIEDEIVNRILGMLPDRFQDTKDEDLFNMTLMAIFTCTLGFGSYLVWQRIGFSDSDVIHYVPTEPGTTRTRQHSCTRIETRRY